MNTKNLATRYSQLSVEERFRLIVAAWARGDDAERQRFKNASKHKPLSYKDYIRRTHSPSMNWRLRSSWHC